jgi:iron complex outermembrane receptor protein
MTQNKHNFTLAGKSKLSDRISIDVNATLGKILQANAPLRIDRLSQFALPRNEKAELYKQYYKTADGYFAPSVSTEPIYRISGNLRNELVGHLLWEQNENEYPTDRTRITGSGALNIKVVDPLNVKVVGGADLIQDIKERKEMWKAYSNPSIYNLKYAGAVQCHVVVLCI